MKLNLGCSDAHISGFLNIDIVPPADKIVDLSYPWPFEDSSADEVRAFDICEHIPDMDVLARGGDIFGLLATSGRHKSGRIFFLNELWRVMKPGAICQLETPNAARGSGYFQDPSHVSPYCLSTFKYFEEGAFARQRLGAAYGITARFKVLELGERETNGEDPREKAFKIRAVLECVK